MTPAAPGCLGQSAADFEGVVSAGLHFFYGCFCFVTVPQSCINHPLVIYERHLVSDTPMKCCENLDKRRNKGLLPAESRHWHSERIRDISSKMLLHIWIVMKQRSSLNSVNRERQQQFAAICFMQWYFSYLTVALERIHTLLNVLWWSLIWKMFSGFSCVLDLQQ